MNPQVAYLFVSLFALVSSDICDKYGIRLYEDMGCAPINKRGPCPSGYRCTLTSNPDQCVVRGEVYNKGDSIPKDKSSHTCEFGCSCGRPEVSCALWGCGDWAGVPPVPEGCYREYTLEACCSTGVRCPPLNDTTTCLVDGVEYKSGEKFFPKDSCHACVCQKGFRGRFEEPYCKRRGCDAQVLHQDAIQKSCAAVFTKRHNEGEAKCCPSQWICPDGSEVIKSTGKISDPTCKFGEKTLQIGDSFEREIGEGVRKRVKCECKIPPLVMCFE